MLSGSKEDIYNKNVHAVRPAHWATGAGTDVSGDCSANHLGVSAKCRKTISNPPLYAGFLLFAVEGVLELFDS